MDSFARSLSRRRFLAGAGAAASVAALSPSLAVAATAKKHEDFNFVFLTDTHIEPELNASQGCSMAFRQMSKEHADFALQGGDHVFDSLGVPTTRSLALFDLYEKTQQDLGLKTYHTIGNHDVIGVYAKSGVALNDPLFGKKYYADHISPLYYSFDHKGVHFVVLDSIGITADRHYEGRIDDAQIAWLAKDLAAQGSEKPVIVSTHIPLVTAMECYVEPDKKPSVHSGPIVNSKDVIQLFEGHNVIGVLQGHTHINEQVTWHGVPYVTSGAVSGNWWHGTHMGAPEGYTMVSVRNGNMETRYETYGFKSVDPKNT
ncbi:metallophosphoesterase family protein [Granulicella cerasi]|uniref:Metallophosphoesterase family protein n=1 Tax=Granulicella cerasi TaxID=741063 RepID=A0ABW1Z6W5_9BACT|nr:metallophosphoesterase [Granulicella cerasi]